MNIEKIQIGSTQIFKGKRLDKNAVSQLVNNNPYSLNDLNQRRISKSIEQLAKIPGDKNIQFLLDTAAKVKYSTSIILEDMPKNDWKSKLLTAASAAIAITPFANSKFANQLADISKNKNLTKEEQELLSQREQLLGVVDLEQINNETNGTMKDFKKNLDYFIVSSETTLEHKKYVLERLNYFMSDKYEINPQLKNKKSIVAAEIINDIAISVPGNKIPNIKAVNQHQHGICAAISIVRKKLAYEDKPNFVDSILSELDSTDKISVYDRSCLGSGKKTDVHKIPVDFTSALAKGYRIIDASSMHWMQIGSMNGQSNVAYNVYTPFDKENFGTKEDTFFNASFENEEIATAQKYYNALINAKSIIENYKAAQIKKNIIKKDILQKRNKNLKDAARLGNFIKNELRNIAPSASDNEIQKLYSGILELKKTSSNNIKPDNKYAYLPNEEESIKKEKIKNYIINNVNCKDIKESSIDKILFMINRYNEASITIKKPSTISKAYSLFKLAAAFRYQIIAGLEDKKTLANIMYSESIPNKEALVLDTINKLIKEVETNSKNANLIIKQISPDSQKHSDALESLYALKEKFVTAITTEMDNIYASLTLTGRKEALLDYLNNLKTLVEEDDRFTIQSLSEQYNIKKSPTKIINFLENDIQKLKTGDEKEYSKLFDKYGNISQIEYLHNIFNDFIQKSTSEENQELVASFLEANGLKIEDDAEAFTEKVKEIENKIISIENLITFVTNMTKIVDDKGNILYSAEPKDIIIKRLENDQRMVSAKQLQNLETHLDSISKGLSSDEFQSRRGKVKDKSLLKFSNDEKVLLKNIDRSVDMMYSYVKKQLHKVHSDIRPYLEELSRISGINNGIHWISEKSSGLYTMQDINILEYITGRPHYSTNNIKAAIDTIKESPYSGISASSVYHNTQGGHIQYIADIKPITIANKNGESEIKEALFHDNTWGASEKENTWVDSTGLTRTDYNDNRGGTLGYIVDSENYRNGNFVDRILSDMVVETSPSEVNSKIYKKIKHGSESSKYPQYYDVILEGISSSTKTISNKLHDALFTTFPSDSISKIKKLGENSTELEIRNIITRNKTAEYNWNAIYQKLYNRINPLFGESIKTEAEYNKLANDDYFKVILEKIALEENGSIGTLQNDLAKVRNTNELPKYRAAQKNRAINSFKYAFTKTYKTIDYLAKNFNDDEYEKIDTILKKYNINLTDDEFNKIKITFSIDKDLFDGSAKTTINLLMESIEKDIDKITQNPDAKQELENYFRNYFNEKIYFNKDDLDLSKLENQNISNIINFIDRVFDPYDDEEFIEIFRHIQDMTEEEFKKEILSKATYEDMGIKSVNGYTILKRLQRGEEKAERIFMNNVYYDYIINTLTKEKTTLGYKYNKFTKQIGFNDKQNLETIYTDLQDDLSILDLPKIFNQYKGENYQKYGLNPAYPQIEVLSQKYLETTFNSAMAIIEDNIETISQLNIQLRNYDISELLHKLLEEAPEDLIISGNNYYNLNNLFGELVTLNQNDPTLNEVTNAAEEVLKLDEGQPWSEYLPFINSIIFQIYNLKKSLPIEKINTIVDTAKKAINKQNRILSKGLIQTKYQNDIEENLKQYEKALAKYNIEKAELLKDTLFGNYKKYHILNNTEELLEKFTLSIIKNSQLNEYNQIYESILERALDYAKLMKVQEIIIKALRNGTAMTAKEQFDKYNIKLNIGNYSMNSDEVITYIANSLILDQNLDTALMFLEKFGLNEQYVNHIVKALDLETAKKSILEGYSISHNFNSFKNDIIPIIQETQAQLENDNNSTNKTLNKLENIIKENGTKHSIDKADIKHLLDGIKIVKYNYQINPSQSKRIIFDTVMNDAQNNMVNSIKEKIDKKNQSLRSIGIIADFIMSIMLNEDSEAESARTEFLNNLNKVVELRNSLEYLPDDENSDKI